MSEMGKGKPVDALDNKCKNYKDCQKCVREKYGDACIGEFVRYTWKWDGKKKDFVSKNDDGKKLKFLIGNNDLLKIPVKRSSSCVTSNLSNNHIANVVYSPRTITPSGPQPVSIMKKTVHQLVVIQSSMNAAVELTSHSNGSDLTTGNVAQTELS